MLFDEWNSVQAASRAPAARANNSRQSANDGYESDEERIPTSSASAHAARGQPSRLQSQPSSNSLALSSSIITSPGDVMHGADLSQVSGLAAGGAGSDSSPAMFQLERLDWRPSKEQGALVALAVGNGVLFIATANCCLIRWNVDTDEFEEIALSKRADDRIHKVFLDPTGHHGLICMANGAVHYMHSRWNKAHLLAKVKGVIVESVAWNSAAGNEATTGKILIGTNRGLIYETVIKDKDQYFKKIHDLCFDEGMGGGSAASGGGSSAASPASGSGADLVPTTPVSGLYMELFPSSADSGDAGQKWFVMAATPNRQFQFIGGPTFEALFARYTGNIPNSFRDFPGDLPYAELRTFSKYQGRAKAATADRCAWMNGVGLYYGNLVFGSQDKGQDVLQNGKLLAYPAVPDAAAGGGMKVSPPVSLALTEFHFLLVMRNRLMAINQLSEDIVYEEVFNPAAFGEMQGLAVDSRKDAVWLYSDKFVFAVDIVKEDRDAWKLYLAEGKFELALEYADTDQQIERINNAKADYLFEQGSFEAAAKIYADTGRSFEEVALKFVHISSGQPVPLATNLGATSISPISVSRITPALASEARSALKAYLLAKLNTLEPTELTQQVMICTWLTEIFLDNINRLQEQGVGESAASLMRKRAASSAGSKALSSVAGVIQTTSPFADHLDAPSVAEDDDEPSAEELVLASEERAQLREAEVKEFRAFLVEFFDCLNRETTFELIASHGRIHELLFYATTIGDIEWVLNYHVQQANYFAALDVLAQHDNPQKILDKYYKFAPTLMYYLPRQTVDMLIDMGKQLDPSKLIPALMRYADAEDRQDRDDAERKDDEDDDDERDDVNHAIRYLEHMILKLRNRDPVIHNYLISLYAKQKSTAPLERFIESQKAKIHFDYKYALRVCHEEHKYRACVQIYEAMNLYEEAVRMALEIDLELAKSVVAHAQADAELNPAVAIDAHQRKRLWILIARHVIDHQQDISKAMLILKECDVRLEEILPFFPDFVRIGDFKEEICKSLDQYNQKIEALKGEMEEYTDSANLIRADINSLRSRSGAITSNQKCDLCSQTLLTRQFYLFPCTHTFHVSCVHAEVTKYLTQHPQRRAQVLADEEFAAAQQNNALPSSSSKSSAADAASREARCIENFASSECCLCGDMMVDSVCQAFINRADESEQAEERSWQI